MRRSMGIAMLLVACGHADPASGAAGSSSTTSTTSTTSTSSSSTDTGTSSGSTGGPPLAIEGLEAIVNPSNALSFFVQWTTTSEVSTALEVDCGEDYRQSFAADRLGTVHEVFVMGLIDGLGCTATATATDGVGDEVSASVEFDVGPLPDGIPVFTVDVNDEAARQAGWTLTNLTNRHLDVPMKMIVLDAEGRPRWYHEVPEGAPGEDNDLRLVSEGLLLGGTWNDIYPAIYSWEGHQVWVDKRLNHHDIRPDLGDENRLWLLSRNKECPVIFDGLKVDSVHLYDRTLDEDVFRWNICDHYVPPSIYLDWDHINTIELIGEDAFMVSSRSQHKLFYVDRSSGDIVWELGQYGDFILEGVEEGTEVWFGRQHAPEIQPNGNIVMFDNGRTTVREWSRGLELELDLEAMTARVVWQFRPDPDIYAEIWGDADRQDNGNTVMVFGRRDPELDTHIYEVTAAGEVVWHLRTPNGWGMYRAERIEPRYGEAKPARGP